MSEKMKVRKSVIIKTLILAIPTVITIVIFALAKYNLNKTPSPTQTSKNSTEPISCNSKATEPIAKNIQENLKNDTTEKLSFSDISPAELKSYLDEDKEIFLVDVFNGEQEHIEGTDEVIPFDTLADSIALLPADLDSDIVVYCKAGKTSLKAANLLVEMGYTNVKNLTGGMTAWVDGGYHTPSANVIE